MLHPAGVADDASAGVMLDHLAREQTGRGDRSRPTSAAGTLRIAKKPRAGGHMTGQAIDADQDRQAPGRRSDRRDNRRDQRQIAFRPHDPSEPESRGDRHRLAHPGPHGDGLDVHLIDLDAVQLDLPALDMMPTVALVVPAGPSSPVAAGPLVEVEARNVRLRWQACRAW